jgi:hypothetical protein
MLTNPKGGINPRRKGLKLDPRDFAQPEPAVARSSLLKLNAPAGYCRQPCPDQHAMIIVH